MKSTDLKPLYSFEERRPYLDQNLFFIPKRYENYQIFELQPWEQLFGNKLPVSIEFCSGNGSWIIERAKNNPQCNFIAVERRFDRVRKIVAKSRNGGLSNLLVVWGEAQDFVDHYVQSHSISEVFINFPDPWPKKRHQKHRLMNENFLNDLDRILLPGGEFTFVTDDAEYRDVTLALFEKNDAFSTSFPSPFYLTQYEGYGNSYFEELWRGKGLQINYMKFVKK